MCASPTCGDGVVDPDEECDDGLDNGEAPDACRSTCTLPYCGDSIVDSGEACDLGVENGAPSSTCDTGCQEVEVPDDTDDPDDVDDPAVAPDDDIGDFIPTGSGCSCSSSNAPRTSVPWWALLLGIVFRRRRRR